jgi:hypothetical protein
MAVVMIAAGVIEVGAAVDDEANRGVVAVVAVVVLVVTLISREFRWLPMSGVPGAGVRERQAARQQGLLRAQAASRSRHRACTQGHASSHCLIPHNAAHTDAAPPPAPDTQPAAAAERHGAARG